MGISDARLHTDILLDVSLFLMINLGLGLYCVFCVRVLVHLLTSLILELHKATTELSNVADKEAGSLFTISLGAPNLKI
jgi:hypothetical protein